VKRKPKRSTGQTLKQVLQRERGDIDRMHAIAKALDSMATERGRLLALAFFVHRYDDDAAERLYAKSREELHKLMRPGHDF
jgi:hypothetical protein